MSEVQCFKNSDQLLGQVQLEVDLMVELGYEVFLVSTCTCHATSSLLLFHTFGMTDF